MNAVTTFTQVLNQLAYVTMLGLAILFIYDGRVVSRYWLKRTNIAVYEEEITQLPTIITYVRPINDKITLGRDFKIFYQTGLNEYSDPWNELKHGENSIKDSLLSVSLRHFYQGLTAEKYFLRSRKIIRSFLFVYCSQTLGCINVFSSLNCTSMYRCCLV